MEPSFDVYLSGEALPGRSKEEVISGLQSLFKLDTDAASRLAGSGPKRVKSNVTKSVALKYRAALEKVGAGVAIVRHGADLPTPPVVPASNPVVATKAPEPSSAPEVPPASVSAVSDITDTPAEMVAGQTVSSSETVLAEQGLPSEPPIATDDAPGSAEFGEGLSIAPVGALIASSDDASLVAPVAIPDFGLAAAGEIIPTVKVDVPAVTPSIDHLSLETPREP